MSSPFVAEICMFAFNFPPKGWAFCNGQLLPISQNTALFSLLGTTYGGDGKSTFALPDLMGNTPMAPGDGPGLTQRFLGEIGGSQFVTLLQSEMPFHNHVASGKGTPPPSAAGTPDPTLTFGRSNGGTAYVATGIQKMMSLNALAPAGGSLPHNNMQPYLTLNFCIALQGVFPPRP
jgi:microcystin-dependent protein